MKGGFGAGFPSKWRWCVGRTISVPFAGDGSGVEELTWGQWNVWRMMEDFGSPFMVGGVMRLEEGTTLDGIVHLLAFIMSRHQSLRTRVRTGPDGTPVQVLADAGEVDLEVVDAGEDEDPADVAGAVRDRFESEPFDIAEDWPVRMAVVRKGGVPDHFVALYPHMAIDAYGFDALVGDLANLDRVTGAHLGPRVGVQPMELARTQRSPAVRRKGEASIRHWEQCLRIAPTRRFNGPHAGHEPRYWDCAYDSPAAGLATAAIAARTGLGTGPILLAAYAVTMARVTGVNPSIIRTLVSNRFRPDFAGSVSVLAQPGLCVVDVGDCTFDEAAVRAWRSQLATGKHGYYDPRDLWELRDRIAEERGAEVDLGCYFNDRRRAMAQGPVGPIPTEDEVWAALSHSRLEWGRRSSAPDVKLYLNVNGKPDTLNYDVRGDTQAVSPEELVLILRGIEEVLVAAAFDPDHPTRV
jgi:hypothetical protein